MTRVFAGVVHLRALPSALRFAGSFEEVVDAALRDGRALRDGGADAIVVENFGDAPFHKGTRDDPVSPDVPAALAVVGREIRRETGLPLALNCLRNDGLAALGAAAVAGARWVRVNVLCGSYVTDQGLIDGEAARLAGYRKRLGGGAAILADHRVKHAVPLAASDPVAAARDLVERAGADAIVLSGARTGEPVDEHELQALRAALGEFPLWIGSGLTAHNAPRLWPLCDGAIVGTALKEGGRVDAPVDPRRVEALRRRLT